MNRNVFLLFVFFGYLVVPFLDRYQNRYTPIGIVEMSLI